jgi:hypothetical protein
VDIAAEARLAYPSPGQHVSKRKWRIPGHDAINDGIAVALYGYLYGYIVEIKHPNPGEELIAKDDVMLRASIRTLPSALVRPHGDWDSRKVHIYGKLLIGDRILERLHMFYSGEQANCETPFFVPLPKAVPDGVTLRVVAANPASGNFGVGQAKFPVLRERLTSWRR